MGNMGRIAYGITACVAISTAAVSFAWGDREEERYYNVLGRKLILEPLTVDNNSIGSNRIWRILFPIKTGKGFNGFYGYADFLEVKDGDKGTLKGPIIIEYKKGRGAEGSNEVDSYKGPFSAEDFKTAMEKVEDESLLLVVDLNQFYKKNDKELNGKELLKEIREGAEGSGATLPDIKDTVEKCMLKRVESKYATLIPEKTYAGWKGDMFRVEMDLAGDLGIKASGIDKGQSFISYGGRFYRVGVSEEAGEPAGQKKEAGPKPGEQECPSSLESSSEDFARASGGVKPEAVAELGEPGYGPSPEPLPEVLPEVIGLEAAGTVESYEVEPTSKLADEPPETAGTAAEISRGKPGGKSPPKTGPPGKGREGPSQAVSFFVVSEVRDKGVRVKTNVPDFKKTDFVDSTNKRGAPRDLITCLKVVDGDPFYAPGYIVSETRLFEGEIISAVNTEYGSRLYFDTNMINEYFTDVLKTASFDVKLTREGDAVVYEETDKGEKIIVSDTGPVPGKSEDGGGAQAFVTLDRQLKEGDRVKLEILNGDKVSVLTINEKVKEVKGSAFKDERNLALQALFEREVDAKNVRIKVDYSDFQPISVGRARWFIHGDMVNSEVNKEEYVKGDGRISILGVGGSRFPVRFNLGPSVNGSYFPNDPAEFRHVGVGAVSEFSVYAGNIAEQKYLWRFSLAPEVNYDFNSELKPPVSAGAPSGEKVRREAWKGYFPFAAAYSFDGVRFEAKAAPSVLSKEARGFFGLKNAVALYAAVTASLDPKFVGGLPRGLDSQSAVAVNFTYELGRDPIRFERLGNKFSLGFEYAPVKK